LLRAAEHYLRAALQANAALDFRGTVEMVLAGVRCGAKGELLGELRVVQAEAMAAFAPLEEWSAVAAAGRSLVECGGPSWYRATRAVAAAATRLHDVETLSRVACELLEQEGEPTTERVAALGRVSIELFLAELGELGEAIHERMEEEVVRLPDHGSPEVRALVHASRGRRALAANDRAGYAREMRAAAELFDQAGNLRAACQTLANLGFSLLETGRPAEAEAVTVEAAAGARHLGLEWVEALALHNMGLALAWRGKIEQALEVERRAIEMLEARGEERLLGGAYGYLATILSLAGDHESAETAARRAVELLEPMPPLLQRARAALAQALLGLDRADEAREHARAAAVYLAREGKVGEGEGLVRLMDAETLRGTGDVVGARDAVQAAATRLRERAAQLDDAEGFLRDVPEHVRTLELAGLLGC
jgi:tetratricopeptide (TPR) repeat protein